jgi:2-oxoisovalerate dehydrogenase E1 component
MTEHRPLDPAAPWVEVVATEADWDAAEPVLLTSMFSQLVLIRTFEELVLTLAGEGLVHGPAHSSIGQEGGAVGSVLGLTSDDTVNGSHRGHHQFLAKVLHHVEPKGIDPTAPVSDDVRGVLLRTLAEICGLDRGWSHGRGGSMHLQWHEAGAIGTNAIVGGGVPLAAGSAWAHKQAGTDAVAVTYFGDGAINIGSTLETFNLAAAWQLPICFFVENNRYAVSTTVEEATGEPRLSGRGPGFGIASWRVDGMDPLAVHLAMQEALAHLRGGHGPALVEAEVYRYFHQNGPFPGSAFRYRTKDEEAEWRARDPIDRVALNLTRRGILEADVLDGFVAQAKALMVELADVLLEPLPGGKPGQRRIKEAEWPDPSYVDVGVRGDLSELDGAPYADTDTFTGDLAETKFIEAVAGVMRRRMETDERVVVMGEDVHRLGGGTNGATKGLAEAFPGRVLGTPISENAFTGLGGGVAMDGRFRPVVELMYADFMWVAADQIFNQIGKARHMFGGTGAVPFVLRSKVAMGTGYGSQHSMDPAGVFATAPGWRIVAPSTPFDYVGLMNTALRLDDPVVVLEHVDLYGSSGDGPVDDFDYCLPVGKAAVRRTGSDVTVLTYLAMTSYVLQAVEQVGTVDAEVVDLRWLDRASIDWDTIGASIQKTNRVLIAEQGPRGTSYGGWLADEIQRRFFDWLDHPVERVSGGEASPSISKKLERAAIAQADEVVAALTALGER